MLLQRDPRPRLRPFVKTLWASSPGPDPGVLRERVLPTGHVHIAIRLSDAPLRLFDGPGDRIGREVGHAVVGGARASAYLRDVSRPSASVGALLRPGATQALFGLPADEIAGRHWQLHDLWGPGVASMRERLLEAATPELRLARFESFLAARLPGVRGLHPAVAGALELFQGRAGVADAVEQGGTSHRRFIALFSQAVGLNPKVYCRVLRFQSAVERVAADPALPWAQLALEAGFSDQAHFSREFRDFAGIAPSEYRALAPEHANHVPAAGQIPSIRPLRDPP